MRLSVIVPIYNAEKYLETMLDSILKQSFRDFEVILVNDGSIDNSGIICDSFARKDSRIKVFHIVNHGVSNARNFGLAQARGEYIHFADSDDYMEPEMYAAFNKQVEKTSPDLVLCGCQQIVVSKNYSVTLSSICDLTLRNRQEIRNYLNGIKDEDYRCLLHYIWNKWYRRDLLASACILYPTELSLGEDFVFNCRVMQVANSLEILAKPYYHYFIRGNSLVSAFEKEPWNTRTILLNERISLYKTYDIFEDNKNAIYMEEGKRWFATLRGVNSIRCRLTPSEKTQFVRKMMACEQRQYMELYLKNSNKKLHRIWRFLIRYGGYAGVRVILWADWMQKRWETKK